MAKKVIKKTYDPQADAFYIYCKKGVVERTENKGEYIVDYDKRGDILGYEILDYSLVTAKLGEIDGIPLVPPYEAIILPTAKNRETTEANRITNSSVEIRSVATKTKGSSETIFLSK